MGPPPGVVGLAARMLTDPRLAEKVVAAVARAPDVHGALLSTQLADCLALHVQASQVGSTTAAVEQASDVHGAFLSPEFADYHALQERATSSPPLVVAPPPGLEHIVPAAPAPAAAWAGLPAAAARAGAAGWGGLLAAAACTREADREPAVDPSPKEARRMTVVLAYFPRRASDADLRSALDAALGRAQTVRRCRVVRDQEGNGLYGFFELRDAETTEAALAACARGAVVLKDEHGHTWHIRASRSERATVGSGDAGSRRRHRGRRGGAAQHASRCAA